MCCIAVTPSISGILRSIKTTSGLRSPTNATASLPFWASPTTSKSGSPESIPLRHALEAKATGVLVSLPFGLAVEIEALAVVARVERDGVSHVGEGQRHPVRSWGVLADVGEGLLRHPKERRLDLRGQRTRRAGRGHAGDDTALPPPAVGQPFQSLGERSVLQGLRSQGPNQTPRLRQALPRGEPRLIQVVSRPIGAWGHSPFGRLKVHHDAGEPLR